MRYTNETTTFLLAIILHPLKTAECSIDQLSSRHSEFTHLHRLFLKAIMITALIVEDSITDRNRLKNYLQIEGITVKTAQSSEEAIKIIEEASLDLIFLDVVLPGQSGFELCRDLKTAESTQSLPVVICSTKATKADKLWGSMLGADAYLTKPVDQQRLAATVAQLIS